MWSRTQDGLVCILGTSLACNEVSMLVSTLLMLSAAMAATSRSSTLQLHDTSGQGSIEFEPTGATKIQGDINGINFSVPITISSPSGGDHACTLGYEGGALRASCPIVSPGASVCSERMDFVDYGTVWNSRCTVKNYGSRWVENTSEVFTGCTFNFNYDSVNYNSYSEWSCPTRNGISISPPANGTYSRIDDTSKIQFKCVADAEPDRCSTWFDTSCHRYQMGQYSSYHTSPSCNATGCTYTCNSGEWPTDWHDEDRFCSVLQTTHSTNSLQACGDLCASDKACSAITFMDHLPPGKCNLAFHDGFMPIPGMCILFHFPIVGNGISSLKIQATKAVKSSSTRHTYDRWCIPFVRPGKSLRYFRDPHFNFPSNDYFTHCAFGPGSDANWPRECGIVSYRKASASANFSSSGPNETIGTFNYTAMPSFISHGSC